MLLHIPNHCANMDKLHACHYCSSCHPFSWTVNNSLGSTSGFGYRTSSSFYAMSLIRRTLPMILLRLSISIRTYLIFKCVSTCARTTATWHCWHRIMRCSSECENRSMFHLMTLIGCLRICNTLISYTHSMGYLCVSSSLMNTIVWCSHARVVRRPPIWNSGAASRNWPNRLFPDPMPPNLPCVTVAVISHHSISFLWIFTRWSICMHVKLLSRFSMGVLGVFLTYLHAQITMLLLCQGAKNVYRQANHHVHDGSWERGW